MPGVIRSALVPVFLLAACLAAPAASAEPIAPGTPPALALSSGGPVAARPMKATTVPRNPFMARNPFSNIHNDTWMTDAYAIPGPLGRSLVATSASMPAALCGSLAFDRKGLIVTVCPSAATPPQARIIDPGSLSILATYNLPGGGNTPGIPLFQNFTGGGYFFLDGRDRIWSATKTNHLFVLAQGASGRSLRKVADYDLTGVLRDDERITSALPAFDGRIWLVSKKSGKVAVLDPATRKVRVLRLGEQVENSFAVDRDAIYLVSDRRMYRMGAGRSGKPRIDWKVTYKNSGIHKPGQVDAGSGTTPTIMAGGLVAITDNADPMNVVVYRRAKRLSRGQRRTVCEVPVFGKGTGATENSLVTAGRALIVENNYGYGDPFAPTGGGLTQPGFARVDVLAGGKGCRKAWETLTERGASVVPKLSAATGLIYTYTRDEDPAGGQPWFWTAIDAATGLTAFKQYAGSGLPFNNNYAGLALGPDGSAYLGVIGGIVKLSDG